MRKKISYECEIKDIDNGRMILVYSAKGYDDQAVSISLPDNPNELNDEWVQDKIAQHANGVITKWKHKEKLLKYKEQSGEGDETIESSINKKFLNKRFKKSVDTDIIEQPKNKTNNNPKKVKV